MRNALHHPIRVLVIHALRRQPRHEDHGIAELRRTGFEHANIDIWIFRQAIGEDKAGGAAAHDQIIKRPSAEFLDSAEHRVIHAVGMDAIGLLMGHLFLLFLLHCC